MRLFSYLAIVMATLVQLPAAAQVIHPCNATGTCGNVSAPSMSGNFVVPLANQERETPVVNNNSYVTQQVTQQIVQQTPATNLDLSSYFINSVVHPQHPEGSAPWMVNGGARACQVYGFATGYVIEYFGAWSRVSCFR